MPDETGPQRPSEGRAPNTQVVQLKLRLQALTERVDDQDATVEDLRAQVGGVAQTIERLAAGAAASKPVPVWWPALSDDEYAELRPKFLGWLRDVLAARYPTDARKLLPCWWRHPAAEDALTKAWLTWQAAELNRAAEPNAAAMWQTQWRPQLLELVRLELKDCRDSEEHRPRVTVDPDLLATFEPVHDR